MTIQEIMAYTLRAMAFALPVGGLYLAARTAWLKRRGTGCERKREELLLLLVIYLAALIQITGIRSASHLLDWWTIPHSLETVQLIPLVKTLVQWRSGAWAVIYPVFGNLLWFFPFGFLLPALRPNTDLKSVAVRSLVLSLAIEVFQWVLCSGISDIDDVMFNICGSLAGFACYRAFQKRPRRNVRSRLHISRAKQEE